MKMITERETIWDSRRKKLPLQPLKKKSWAASAVCLIENSSNSSNNSSCYCCCNGLGMRVKESGLEREALGPQVGPQGKEKRHFGNPSRNHASTRSTFGRNLY